MTMATNPDSCLPILCFLLVLICQLQHCTPQTVGDREPNYKRVCYYTNWSQYRRDKARFLPLDIDPFLCTHLIFAFAKVDQGVLAPYEWNDMQHPFLYKQFTDLKKSNPELKTMLAVGGWNHGSLPFTAMVRSPGGRSKFIRHAIKYLRGNRFDGLDLDWEYPASRGSPSQDKQNFVSLAKELREAFEMEAKKSGEDRLLLTMAVPGGEKLTLAGYDVRKLNKYVDFFNLMSYDLHGGWSATIGHHAPLQGGHSWAPAESEPQNVEKAVNLWLKLGADPKKLVMGLAFYGKTFELCSKSHQAGNKSCGGGRPESLPYYEILRQLRARRLKRGWLEEEQVPFAISDLDRLWVGYDDEQSLLAKVNFAKSKHLGGVMVWSLDQDDFTGRFGSHGTRYPLLTTIRDALADRLVTQAPFSADDDLQRSGKADKKDYATDLKPRPVSFKQNTQKQKFLGKQPMKSVHPSAVPLFANLIGQSHSLQKTHSQEKVHSDPFRKVRAKTSTKKNRGSKNERNKSGQGKKKNYLGVSYNANKGQHVQEWTNTKSGNTRRLNKPIQSKQKNSRDRFVQNTGDTLHLAATDQNRYDKDMIGVNKLTKHKPSGRLIRGNRRRKSGSRVPGRSPHRRNPVVYHPTQTRSHRIRSAFPERVPFSILSVQTNPPDEELYRNPELHPWNQPGNIHLVDASLGATRVSSPRTQNKFLNMPNTHRDNTKGTGHDVHPFSDRFSASLNINERDSFVKLHEKPLGNSDRTRERMSLPDGRLTNNDVVDEDRSRDEGEGNTLRQASSGDPVIEVELDEEMPVGSEYEIIQHDSTRKWYEPILYQQKQQDLDLKLSQALPYNVPWRSNTYQDHVTPDSHTDLQIDDNFRSRRHHAAQLTPYSGDKFVRVHAVPMSGFSLADLVHGKSDNDSNNSSERSRDILGKRDNHLKKYHSPRPWFSTQTKDAQHDSPDVDLDPEKDLQNDKGRAKTRTQQRKQTHGLALQTEDGHHMRKVSRRRSHLKVHRQALENSSDAENEKTKNPEHDDLKKTSHISSAASGRGEKLKKSISFSQSVHNDDVWWEFPEIETYQAVNAKDRESSPNSRDPHSNTSKHLVFEPPTYTDRPDFFASAPVVEPNDVKHLTSKQQNFQINQLNQSDTLEGNNTGIACQHTNDCNKTSIVNGEQSDTSRESKENREHFLTLTHVHQTTPFDSDLSENDGKNGTLLPLQNRTISHADNKTDISEFPKLACDDTQEKRKSLDGKILNSVDDVKSTENRSDCNSTLNLQSQTPDLRNEEFRHKKLTDDDLPRKPTSYSLSKVSSKRRKAGRRPPHPQPYHNIDISRSPFKPPPKADLYHVSSISRISRDKSLNKAEFEHRNISQHKTHKLERLRQLLRNSSLVEKLKSKLDELHQKVRVTPTSAVEIRTDLGSNVELQDDPHHQRSSQRPWYHLGSDSQKVRSSSSPRLETKPKNQDGEPEENNVKGKFRHNNNLASSVLEGQTGNVEKVGEKLLRQHGSETKGNSEANTELASYQDHHPRNGNETKSPNLPKSARRAWWDQPSERKNNSDSTPNITEKGANNLTALKSVASILRKENESTSSRKSMKSRRKKIPKSRRRRLNHSDRNTAKHLSEARHARDGQADRIPGKVVREVERHLTGGGPPAHELYIANFPAVNKTIVSKENISDGNQSIYSNNSLIVSPQLTQENSGDKTLPSSSPHHQRVKSLQRLRSRQHIRELTNHSRVDHSTANHSRVDHSTANHSRVDHSTANHSRVDHSTANHSRVDHSTANHSRTDPFTGLPESPPENIRSRDSTAGLTISTVAMVTTDNKQSGEEAATYPVPESYNAKYHKLQVKGHDLENLERDSIKHLVRGDGQGGWSILKDAVTPATIPGASLVTSGFSSDGFSCPSTFGIYRDPDNCRMFYQCVWFVAFHHVCGQGTAWNDYDRICDWPLRTNC